MNVQLMVERIHDHLRDPSTRQRLNARFATARDQLTTSIGEAARLAGVPPEKARYAESIGMLSPRRSSEKREDKGAAHRRYSLGELNRLIIMGDLLAHGFSMSDISHYLNRERNTADMLVDSIHAADLTTRMREAETAYLQRMLIPRLFYFTQCLLLGDIADCAVAVVLPVEQDPARKPANDDITRVDDLPRVGPSLVGWHSRSHPYCVLYMQEPRMDDATHYEIRSIDEMCRDAGVPDVDDHPTGAYLLIEREFARRFPVSLTSRSQAETGIPSGGESEQKHPNPLAVAHRFLRLLRQPADEESRAFGHSFTSAGDGMVYSSPEFMSDMTGDGLLSEISELVVRLGNDARMCAPSQRGQWVFSAILLPDNPSLPPGRQSLVVMAQSKRSPHTVGITRLTPGKNEGLSTLAALSGHMLIRRSVDSTDAAVADAGFEGVPGPALAMPVISAHGRVLAVLYVRSKYDENTTTHETFTSDDQLLLRVIGHMIGEIVFTYRGNYLARDVLAGMIEEPRYVDRFLQEFHSANAFWADLQKSLNGQIAALSGSGEANRAKPEGGAINPITLLAVDVDRHSNIVNAYGSNTARHLIRAVGRRIAGQPLLTSSPLMGASDRSRNKLYHIYGDRFFLLLENMSQDYALAFARNLRDMLSGSYALEITRTIGSQAIPLAAVTVDNISVRIAVISYDSNTLGKMLASVTPTEQALPNQRHEPVQYVISVITSALDAGLNQGKQIGPGAIMYLDTDRSLFRQLPEDAYESPMAPNSGPLQRPVYGNSPIPRSRSDRGW